ncbi:MAG TPA: hypothetical protein VFM16_00550, partial [Holophagaceae bacterium]|nr:hypothetical protein [Holophagaceae bacterium]
MSPERRAVLATRHGKGPAFARALSPLGIAVVVTEAVDTDALGNFSGERPRSLSALDTARAKARAALDLGAGALAL